MTRRLSIAIESGETTCASEPGKFCRFAGATRFGTTPVCLLFPSKDGAHSLLAENERGWLMRLPACLEAER